jgi:hypothetical protein
MSIKLLMILNTPSIFAIFDSDQFEETSSKTRPIAYLWKRSDRGDQNAVLIKSENTVRRRLF